MKVTLNIGDCPDCLGKGFKVVAVPNHDNPDGFDIKPTDIHCTRCEGSGKLPKPILEIDLSNMNK